MPRPILGIDTASRPGSLAIAGITPPIAEDLGAGGRHAASLMPEIERLLRRAGIAAADLRGIGVVLGPGSFTGLRVGLATAKGLGYALDIAVEGLSTLEVIARAAAAAPGAPADRELCALVEAGRGELYAARFAVGEGAPRRLSPDAAWEPEALAASLAPGTLLAGNGAARLATVAGGRFETLPVARLAPIVAEWAAAMIPEGARYRPGGSLPNYVRSSGAEPPRRRT